MADATHVARLRVATSGGRGAVTARALVEDALRCEADATGPAARRGVLVLRRLAAGSAHGRALRGRVAGLREEVTFYKSLMAPSSMEAPVMRTRSSGSSGKASRTR